MGSTWKKQFERMIRWVFIFSLTVINKKKKINGWCVNRKHGKGSFGNKIFATFVSANQICDNEINVFTCVMKR